MALESGYTQNTQSMGHKGGGLKAPEFFIQLLSGGMVWHQTQHLLLGLQ